VAERREGLLSGVALRSATALVIANIIGAGIFTTTGFQAADLPHPGYIFLLWIVGGLLALAGAACYAELGAALPEAGAEYVYLRETYGAALAFMSAFVSLVAGFSAPIAAACKSFVRYCSQLFPALAEDRVVLGAMSRNDLLAIALVWILVAVHLRGLRGGFAFNDLVTLLKVMGIAGVVLAALIWGSGSAANLATVSPRFVELGFADRMAGLATALIFVSFCYSGFNAAAYVAAEMRDPQRDLPRALIGGTALVVVLYLALNAVFLYGAGVDELAGVVEVGLVSGRNLFGSTGASAVAVVIAVSILASASAMTIAGPRVYYAFGRDFPPLRGLARTGGETGAPWVALLLQGTVTSVIILSGRIDQIQQYAGFTLSLFASLAVSCVLVLRRRRPRLERPFRVWAYPFTPLLFLAVSLWTMAWALRGRPLESSLSLVTVVTGGLLFALLRQRQGRRRPSR
jgi:APA family basic amino acid/polyamine antiporter